MDTETLASPQSPFETTQRRLQSSVQLRDVLDFVFPAHLQHPLSLGRLYAFALYGPLDENNQLRGGAMKRRVLSTMEIDIMCKAFEREDIVRIYMFEGRPLHTLTAAEQDEFVAQADSKLKSAKGRGMMKQLTRQEVVELFEDLPTDEYGGYSFHDLQRRIEEYREKRIADAKVVFPLMSKPTTTTGTSGKLGAPMNTVTTTSTSTSLVRRIRKQPEKQKRRMNDIELRAHEAKLLARNAFRVCELETSNEPGIISNLRLMRQETSNPTSRGREKWDTTSCLNGTQVGSRVKCIPHGSSTR